MKLMNIWNFKVSLEGGKKSVIKSECKIYLNFKSTLIWFEEMYFLECFSFNKNNNKKIMIQIVSNHKVILFYFSKILLWKLFTLEINSGWFDFQTKKLYCWQQIKCSVPIGTRFSSNQWQFFRSKKDCRFDF